MISSFSAMSNFAAMSSSVSVATSPLTASWAAAQLRGEGFEVAVEAGQHGMVSVCHRCSVRRIAAMGCFFAVCARPCTTNEPDRFSPRVMGSASCLARGAALFACSAA